MNVLASRAESGHVNLHEPLDANVSSCRLSEPSAAHALVILEENEQLVVGEDLTDDSLRDVAFLHRLIARATGMDVANPLEYHIDEAHSGSVLVVSDGEGKLNVIVGESVEENKEVGKGSVLRHQHDSLVHVHQLFDSLDSRLLNKETLAKSSKDFGRVVESR